MKRREFEVNVVRKSLCEQSWNVVISTADDAELFKFPAESPHPNFSGTIQGILKCISISPQTCKLIIRVDELNLVRASSMINQQLKSKANPSPLQTSNLQTLISSDENFAQLFSAICSHPAGVIIFRIPKPDRLHCRGGKEFAKYRVSAIFDGEFMIYPSSACIDAWEVRYLDRENSTIRFERFLDWGQDNLLYHIDVCLSLGTADRFDPSLLAEEDPGVLWAICLRYRACIKKLDAAGLPVWSGAFRAGVNKASTKMVAASDASIEPHWKLLTLESRLLEGGEAVRASLSERGALLAITFIARPEARTGPPLGLELDNADEVSQTKSILSGVSLLGFKSTKLSLSFASADHGRGRRPPRECWQPCPQVGAGAAARAAPAPPCAGGHGRHRRRPRQGAAVQRQARHRHQPRRGGGPFLRRARRRRRHHLRAPRRPPRRPPRRRQ